MSAICTEKLISPSNCVKVFLVRVFHTTCFTRILTWMVQRPCFRVVGKQELNSSSLNSHQITSDTNNTYGYMDLQYPVQQSLNVMMLRLNRTQTSTRMGMQQKRNAEAGRKKNSPENV